MNKENRFIEELLVIAPCLIPIYNQHLKDNCRILPAAFIEEVAQFVIENTQSKTNIDASVIEVISFLEVQLEEEKNLDGKGLLHNLVGDSFIAKMLNKKETLAAILHLMGQNLRSIANEKAIMAGYQKSCISISTDAGLIERTQNWYSLMCNDEWEHISSGIEIGNIGNPGWKLEVDLMYTPLYGLSAEKTDFNLYHETDWAFYSVENGKFIAAGGPKMLATLLTLFLNWAEENTPPSSKTLDGRGGKSE